MLAGIKALASRLFQKAPKKAAENIRVVPVTERGDVWFIGHAGLKDGLGHTTFELLRPIGSTEVTFFPPQCAELISDECREYIECFLRARGYTLAAAP
ncbi:hypothetical protein C4552_04110 [Candidatus Parcubacteria bacterium]|nr:MAG: hypothetical protein C4552_04110 [Candidatus Parcubacteria bacterium]